MQYYIAGRKDEAKMELTGFKKYDEYALVETSKGKLKLEPFCDSVIRIVYTQEESFSDKESLIVLPKTSAFTGWSLESSGDHLELATGKLRLKINKKTCAFSYYDAKGRLLVKEPDEGGKYLSKIDVYRHLYDKEQEIKVGQSVDGLRTDATGSRLIKDRCAYHTKLMFEWSQGEALYGLGSHEEGIMNLRGSHQYLYQQNMKAVVPVLLSTRGYGVLVDSCSLAIFRDDAYGSYIWTDTDDEMDYYFIYGPGFDDIIGNYRQLTGKAPLLPKWAFGYIQSKERYTSAEELISVVKEFRKRRIPLDLIVLDWMSWPENQWGQKSFDPVRFPDPEGMMEELHRLNARLMVSIWPNMAAGGANHSQMLNEGFLLGNQSTYDAFNKDARELYWKQANEGLFSKGIDAWWCDCTEPFEADWKGELKPEPEERLVINTGEAKKYLDPEYINAYSLLHSEGIYEGQRRTRSDKRVVNLTRSSYAGQHRYATITWSGDIAASWDTLRKQIPAGLNFTVTGEPYWTVDIGAFFVAKRDFAWFWNGNYNDGCNDPGYRELFVRWLQYGAFLPIFRAHGTDTPREPWRFGEEGTIFYDALVKFIKLRYRLLPYIYSLAGMVTHDNYTMMRALAFDFLHDEKTYDIKDQYMFGPAFMVNPVTEPMYYESGYRELTDSKKSRRVYLPAGCSWYDFWTNKLFEGGQLIEADAPLDIMPLFVRSGSILPLGPHVEHTGEKTDAPLELRIYRGASGSFTLYEDEGDGYNYEKGACSKIRFDWDDVCGTLTIHERVGSYPGMPAKRSFNVVLVAPGHGAGLEAEKNADAVIEYSGEKISYSFYSIKS